MFFSVLAGISKTNSIARLQAYNIPVGPLKLLIFEQCCNKTCCEHSHTQKTFHRMVHCKQRKIFHFHYCQHRPVHLSNIYVFRTAVVYVGNSESEKSFSVYSASSYGMFF